MDYLEDITENTYTRIDPDELEALMEYMYQAVVALEALEERIHKILLQARRDGRTETIEQAELTLSQVESGKQWADVAAEPLEQMLSIMENGEEVACEVSVLESLKRGCAALENIVSLIKTKMQWIENDLKMV